MWLWLIQESNNDRLSVPAVTTLDGLLQHLNQYVVMVDSGVSTQRSEMVGLLSVPVATTHDGRCNI